MRIRMWIPGLVAVVLLTSACGRQYIESSLYDDELRVKNTEYNVALTDLMQQYSDALERMDLDAIAAMVSEEYYENAGTTDTTSDDYGQEGLAPMLSLLSEHVEEMRIDVSIRDIVVEQDLANVLFEYSIRARYTVEGQARWESERDVNRLQFQREPGGWRIVSGL